MSGEPPAKKVRRAFSSPIASVVIVVLAVLWTIPVLGLLVTSLRPKGDVASTGWWTFFAHPHLTFSNYNTVLFKGGFNVSSGLAPYIVNSLAITIPATIIPIILASMAAYVLAWVRFKGSDAIFFIIFALQVVPLQMSLVPLLQLYSRGAHIGSTTVIPGLNLHGSLAEVWISHTMFSLPLAVFLLHNFISQLPESVIEAARVDGASHLRIYRSIVLPLSMPAIASFAIFQFLWVWNDLLVSLTFAAKIVDSPAADRTAAAAHRFVRQPPRTAHRRSVRLDRHSDDRVLLAAALLRQGHARRQRQGLTGR